MPVRTRRQMAQIPPRLRLQDRPLMGRDRDRRLRPRQTQGHIPAGKGRRQSGRSRQRSQHRALVDAQRIAGIVHRRIRILARPAHPRGSRLEQQLGEAYTRRVNRLLSKTEHKDAARLWAKYAAQYDIKETRLSKGAYFSPSDGGIYLNLDTVMAGDSAHRPVQNLFHESGHMLDWLLDKNSFSWAPHNGKLFNDVLKRDAQRIFDTTQATLMAEDKPAGRQSVMKPSPERSATNSAKTDRNVEDMLQARPRRRLPRQRRPPQRLLPAKRTTPIHRSVRRNARRADGKPRSMAAHRQLLPRIG